MRVAFGRYLGQYCQGNLLLRPADRAIGGAPNAFQSADTPTAKHVEDRGGPAAAGDQPNVRDVIPQQRLDGIFVVMTHGGDYGPGARVGLGGREIERIDDLVGLQEVRRHRAWVHRAGPVADRRAQLDERVGRRRIADDEQERSWQLRIDEDLQLARTRAGTEMRDDPWKMLGRLVGRDLHEARLGVAHRGQGLAPHQPFGATAAYPAPEPAVGGDHRLVAGPG